MSNEFATYYNMSLRRFLLIIFLTDLVAWGAWSLLLNTVNPESGVTIIFLFYLILFLALFGAFAVVGLLWRSRQQKPETILHGLVTRSFRQALLFSVLIIIALWLSTHGWLRWWNVLLVIAVLTVGEHLFINKEQAPAKQIND